MLIGEYSQIQMWETLGWIPSFFNEYKGNKNGGHEKSIASERPKTHSSHTQYEDFVWFLIKTNQSEKKEIRKIWTLDIYDIKKLLLIS